MCEVDQDDLGRPDRLASGLEDGDVDREARQDSVPVREVGSGSAPVDGLVRLDRQGSAPDGVVRAGRPEGGRGPNRGRRVQA